MGYKLAGYDVIGCNEIDHRMMYAYCQNHDPKYPFLEPIQDFKLRNDLPEELFNLDILDGSPPCSTFSIAGSREDAWGKMKKFREGQSEQILDTLFFDFIDLAKKLQPKVVVAENVKGILLGKSIKYVAEIYEAFDKAGYYCQHWLLDGQNMGVPQRRERVFFVCLRKDIAQKFLVNINMFEQKPALDLVFNEEKIYPNEFIDYSGNTIKSKISMAIWKNRKYGDDGFGDYMIRKNGKETRFNMKYLYRDKICPTIPGKENTIIHFDKPKYLGTSEVCNISSFPQDYNFAGQSPHYVCGMSVPPIMIAQIATQIYEQWLSNI